MPSLSYRCQIFFNITLLPILNHPGGSFFSLLFISSSLFTHTFIYLDIPYCLSHLLLLPSSVIPTWVFSRWGTIQMMLRALIPHIRIRSIWYTYKLQHPSIPGTQVTPASTMAQSERRVFIWTKYKNVSYRWGQAFMKATTNNEGVMSIWGPTFRSPGQVAMLQSSFGTHAPTKHLTVSQTLQGIGTHEKPHPPSVSGWQYGLLGLLHLAARQGSAQRLPLTSDWTYIIGWIHKE